jgi:hypothetical protein
MKRPSEEVVKQLANISRQYPLFVEWLAEWRQLELDHLPYATNNAATVQGRCQVLSEMHKLVITSSELAAKSR